MAAAHLLEGYLRRLAGLAVSSLLVAAVAGLVRAGGWVLHHSSSPATAPAADPHGPRASRW